MTFERGERENDATQNMPESSSHFLSRSLPNLDSLEQHQQADGGDGYDEGITSPSSTTSLGRVHERGSGGGHRGGGHHDRHQLRMNHSFSVRNHEPSDFVPRLPKNFSANLSPGPIVTPCVDSDNDNVEEAPAVQGGSLGTLRTNAPRGGGVGLRTDPLPSTPLTGPLGGGLDQRSVDGMLGDEMREFLAQRGRKAVSSIRREDTLEVDRKG